jgi:hypothetical protein
MGWMWQTGYSGFQVFRMLVLWGSLLFHRRGGEVDVNTECFALSRLKSGSREAISQPWGVCGVLTDMAVIE